MIQDHTQYLPNKDHQLHKWRLQKWWTLYQCYQDAQDKHQLQYLLTPRSKWKRHSLYWRSQSQNVQTCGYVYHDTNGLNHGPVWKIQSFRKLRKSNWNTVVRRYCKLANKTTQQLHKVATHVLTTINSKKKKWDLLENCQKHAFKLSWNAWTRLRVARRENCFSTEQNTRFKRKVSLEELKAPKGDRFLRGRQIAYLIYEYFRVTGANDSVENYAGPIYNCSSKWWYSGNRFEMGRNSIIDDANPIRWHLGKLVHIKNTRVWETQDRIGIVQYGDSSEESWTWLHRLKTMLKEVSSRIYEWRILRPETEIMKQAPWSRIMGQNSVSKEL